MQSVNDYDGTVKAIEKLIEDTEFQGLKQLLSERTLFDVLGISFEERIHSKMLGWLLAPAESHGLGNTLLRRFLYTAAKLARSIMVDFDGHGRPITPLEAETYSFSDVRIHAEYRLLTERRPDLVLWSEREKWLCVIENKVLSEEGEEQTTDYYDEMLNSFPAAEFGSRLFVFLSPGGLRPISTKFIPMTYSAVASLLGSGLDEASGLGRIAIDQYSKCLRGRIVEQEQLQKICWKLYRNHRAAIDAIRLYGGVNILATKTAERVLEVLRRGDVTAGADRKVEWQSSGGTSTWIAIWPRHWPTRRGYYPGFYRISWKALPPDGDTIQVELGFDGTDGRKVQAALEQIAGPKAADLLASVQVTTKDLDDLDRNVEFAARSMVKLVVESFLLMEEALRQALPQKQ
jgi:hypothetical protein